MASPAEEEQMRRTRAALDLERQNRQAVEQNAIGAPSVTGAQLGEGGSLAFQARRQAQGANAFGAGENYRTTFGQQQGARTQQQQLADILAAQARGQGPSAAQAQLQAGLDQQMRQANAMAAGSRGNPLLAQRFAQQANQAAGLQTNQAAAQLRAQEQLAAQGGLAQVLAGMRGQDAGFAGLANQRQLGFEGLGLQGDVAQAQLQQQAALANQGSQNAALDRALQHEMSLAQIEQAEKERQQKMLGAALSGTATFASTAFASDRELKQDESDATGEVRELLDALNAREYEYRDGETDGEGRHIGIIAQDLAKSKAGRAMLIDTPRGLHVDMKRALAASLAAHADTHKRLKRLEREAV